MFRFNLPTTHSCDSLSDCSNGLEYTDNSGVSRPVFASITRAGEVACRSGLVCDDQPVYTHSPPLHLNYAPCWWDVSVSGGFGNGICGTETELNYRYRTYSPPIIVDVEDDNESATVKIKHEFLGYGTGGCGTTLNEEFTYASDFIELGTISDLSCGLNMYSSGEDLVYTLSSFTMESGVPNMGNHDDTVVTYTPKFNVAGFSQVPFNTMSFDLDWSDCIDVETVIESGQPGCYTQDGDFIAFGDPYSNIYEISLYDALDFKITDFTVNGIGGYDDNVPQISSMPYTCNDCLNLNGNWESDDDRLLDFCCDCPTDMCVTSWDLDLAQPSSIITLTSSSHGTVAQWQMTSAESGCIIEPSGGTFNFDHHYSQTPQSGDLPYESGYWNRCSFEGSTIDVNYSNGFINFTPPVVECQEALSGLPNGHCHVCADRSGPSEIEVVVDIDFKQTPVYKNLYVADYTNFDSRYFCEDGTKVPRIQELVGSGALVGYLSPFCAGAQYYQYDYEEMDFGVSQDSCWSWFGRGGRQHCYPHTDPRTGKVYTDDICVNFRCIGDLTGISPCNCGPELMNGTFILSRQESSCQSKYTSRNGDIQCNCEPCSSGVISPNSCKWVVSSTCGQLDPNLTYDNGTVSGQCPCSPGPVDANGENIFFPFNDAGKQCAGCSEVTLTSTGGNFGVGWTNDCNYHTVSQQIMDPDCPCCPPTPIVTIGETEVLGVPKFYISAQIYWGQYCNWTAGATFDNTIVTGSGGFGECETPYFTTGWDCDQSFSFSYQVPSGLCANGGSITVSSI